MSYRLAASMLLTLSLSACELVASFDRDKIPPPDLMRPDANFTVKPVEDMDAGAVDAGKADGAVLDGSLDGSLSDGEVPPDGASDGAVPDAGTP